MRNLFLAFLLLLTMTCVVNAASRKVKVGVYHSPPIVILEKNSKPTGFGIDVLEAIATQQGWTIEYVPGSWSKTMKAMQEGKIELLVGLPYSSERAKSFYFTNEALISDWGILYRNPSVHVSSVMDLKNKRIALKKGSIHSVKFQALIKSFGIPIKIIYASSQQEVLRLVDSGQASVGVSTRLYSMLNAHKHDILATTIEFNPVEIRFASPKKYGSDLTYIIDFHISMEKDDPNSDYHFAYKKWIQAGDSPGFPLWVMWVMIFAMAAAIGFLILNALLRREVRRRTSQLTEAELRFRQLTDNINHVFLIASADFNLLHYISPAFDKIWPVKRMALNLNPRAWLDYVHPVDKNQLLEELKICGRNYMPRELVFSHFRISDKHGGYKWIYARAYPIFNSNGFISRIAGIMEDITEKKQAEAHLIETQGLLNAIMDNAPALIAAKDLEGNITIANKRMSLLKGLNSVKIIGRNVRSLFSKQDAERISQTDQQAITRKDSIVIEESFEHQNSQINPYLTIKFPLMNPEKEPYGVCSISIDISEQKHAQEILHRYEQIVANSRDFMAFISPQHEVQAVNHALLQAFSKTEKEVLRKPIQELIGEQLYQDSIGQHIRECLSGIAVNYKSWIEFPGLGNRFIDINFNPYKNNRGFIQGVVLDIYDLTQIKRAEDELHRYKEHLEDLVKQRTAALETVNKELEAYSYSIAHDLRAPLRSITSISQVLLEDMAKKMNKTEKKHLGRIVAAGKSMAALIDDILNLARISRSQFKVEQTNLSEISDDIVKHLATRDPERKVEVEIQEDVIAKADPILIRVALENLFSNAWKYTSNKPTAKISFSSQNGNKETVFAVTDNGIGFNTQYAENLFKPFQRLHNVNEYEGTGIGLATVQRIIQRHGGRVWFDAKEGKGATFYFTLAQAS